MYRDVFTQMREEDIKMARFSYAVRRQKRKRKEKKSRVISSNQIIYTFPAVTSKNDVIRRLKRNTKMTHLLSTGMVSCSPDLFYFLFLSFKLSFIQKNMFFVTFKLPLGDSWKTPVRHPNVFLRHTYGFERSYIWRIGHTTTRPKWWRIDVSTFLRGEVYFATSAYKSAITKSLFGDMKYSYL